jgi:hypothetical protein
MPLIVSRIQIGHRRLGVRIFILRDLRRHVAELREHAKLHSLHRFCLPLLFARLLDRDDLFLVVSCDVFFVSDEHTYLHLLLDQVLSLSKVSDELLSLHLFQDLDLVLVDNVGSLKRLFLILELILLVSELLPQQSFFIIQVQEHFEVLV